MAYDRMALKDQLRRHEGTKLYPYKDSVDKWTIGVGHNVQARGISVKVAGMLLDYNVNQVIVEWQGRDPDAERLTDIDRQKFREMVMQQYPLNPEMWTQGGHQFIGYGHNLTYRGVPLHVAEQMLDEDVEWAEEKARKFFTGLDTLDDARQRVVVNMAFNMGAGQPDAQGRMVGGLGEFHGFRTALENRDYVRAVDEMLLVRVGGPPSKWALQVKGRALELAWMMATGETWKGNDPPTADQFPEQFRNTARKVEYAIKGASGPSGPADPSRSAAFQTTTI